MPYLELTTSVRPMKIYKPDAVRLIGGIRCILEGCCKIRLPSDAKCRIDDSMSTVPVQYRCSAPFCRVPGGGAAAREVRLFRVILPVRVLVQYEYCTTSTV